MKQLAIIMLFISIFALFSCESIHKNEILPDVDKENIEHTINDYLTTRYDKVTALNVLDRIEQQKQFLCSDCELGFNSESVKKYFDDYQSETVILYATVDINDTIESITPADVEVAVAYYPAEREKAYIAIYKYDINVIHDNGTYYITEINNTDTIYVDTYGQDIHICDKKIIAIGDFEFNLESEE
ncbi:MAG: hypothetical protein J6I50_07155 [Clostridia bacterium]|nr:hypothetical protein [Clostridia bacterium]